MFKKWLLNPTDVVVITYLVITALLIAMFHSSLIHASGQIAIRLSFIILIIVVVWIQYKWLTGRVSSLIHLFFPLILLIYLYQETDTLNNLIYPVNLDPFFSRIELILFGRQPSLWFSVIIPYNTFAEVMYFGYFSYYLMLIAVPLFFFFRKIDETAEKAMFIIINSFLLFYLIFIVIPVAGPQYYFTGWPELPKGYLFGSVIRWIQQMGEAPTAAFPSSHVSVCLILIIFCYKFERKLVQYMIPIAVLLILSTVYIRAHYVVDIIAAFFITPVIYWISNSFYSKINTLIKPQSYEHTD